jgi:hypothetical protein
VQAHAPSRPARVMPQDGVNRGPSSCERTHKKKNGGGDGRDLKALALFREPDSHMCDRESVVQDVFWRRGAVAGIE